MADQQSRGGKKQGTDQQQEREEHQGVKATTNKEQPGHAQSGEARQEYLKETKERR